MNVKTCLTGAVTILFLLVFFPRPGYAADAKGVMAELQKKYESIEALEANFTQEVSSRHMKAAEKYEGKVHFKKPGKMKWVFHRPTKDVIVSNGKTLWIYQPDLNQVFETPIGQAASNLAIDFLSGLGNLEKGFDTVRFEDKGSTYRLQLAPKQPVSNMVKLTVEIDKSTGFAVRTVVEDAMANETRITFKEIKTGDAKKDSFFEFTPPAGANVLRP